MSASVSRSIASLAVPRRIAAALGIALLTALVPAQASFATFGAGCSGLVLGASSLPRLGQSLQLTYSGPIGNSFYGFNGQNAQPILMLGLSNTQAGAMPLPFLLPAAVTGAQLCEVLVSPDAMALLPRNSAPPFHLSVAIPADPSFVGLALHAQWLTILERTYMGQVRSVTLLTSNAGTAIVGP